MTDEEMRLELKELNVKDNPFDAMLHHSLELTRDLLFACIRFRNSKIPEGFWLREDIIDFFVGNIKDEFSKLSKMSEETVAMCRETSCYSISSYNKFNKANEYLLELERNMQTVFSECVPNRNDRFEQIRLGVDSDEYKRLLELRDIVSKSDEFSSVDCNYIFSLITAINNPDDFERYGMSQKEFEERLSIVDKYNLTEDDIRYMIAYKRTSKEV